jgi:hypothetical protein
LRTATFSHSAFLQTHRHTAPCRVRTAWAAARLLRPYQTHCSPLCRTHSLHHPWPPGWPPTLPARAEGRILPPPDRIFVCRSRRTRSLPTSAPPPHRSCCVRTAWATACSLCPCFLSFPTTLSITSADRSRSLADHPAHTTASLQLRLDSPSSETFSHLCTLADAPPHRTRCVRIAWATACSLCPCSLSFPLPTAAPLFSTATPHPPCALLGHRMLAVPLFSRSPLIAMKN